MVLAALLVLATAVSVSPVEKIDCPDCNGVGSIEIKCPDCNGSGLVMSTKMRKANTQNLMKIAKSNKVGCRSCCSGVYKPTVKGTGKKRITCKTCKGQKKIKVQKP